MLLSLALIFIFGIIGEKVFKKLKLPSLTLYLLIGILLGPSVFNLLDKSLLNISADLRQIILIIILTRAGLSLDINDLKKVGRPAVLLSFVPATFEIIAVTLLGKWLFNLNYLDAALLGTVLAAVSPAVVAPRMIELIDEKIGTEKAVPQLILSGASIDDIYALVLFTSFLNLAQSGQFQINTLLEIPVSILSGVIVGILLGFLISKLIQKINIKHTTQIILMLSISFILVTIENHLSFSGILATMSMAMMINFKLPAQAKQLSKSYNKLWKPGEILLFSLVGASVSINYALKQGWMPVALIALALIIRMVGVYISLINTKLNKKEKIFTLISYSPKATVQAAIGGIPLSLGLSSGELILTVSVIAILFTAPFGAIGIDRTYKALLKKEDE